MEMERSKNKKLSNSNNNNNNNNNKKDSAAATTDDDDDNAEFWRRIRESILSMPTIDLNKPFQAYDFRPSLRERERERLEKE